MAALSSLEPVGEVGGRFSQGIVFCILVNNEVNKKSKK